MTEYTEGQHAGEFLVSEAPGSLSREVVTLLLGENLKAGAVLGKVTINASSVVGSAAAGNTGNGTIGTLSAGTGVQAGVYRAVFVEPATDLGTFLVFDPAGVEIGKGVVGTEFSGQVVFTIADGATDFVAGDAFTITVGAGSGKYKEYDPTNTDGSQTAVAVLYDNVDASLADKSAVIIARNAEVNAAELQWFSGATTNQKTTGKQQLALQGIIAR